MKITFLKAGGWSNSGGDRVLVIHAENLKKRGHQVTVVAAPRRPASFKNRIKSAFSGSKDISNNASLYDNASFTKILSNKFNVINNIDVPLSDFIITTWFETAEWAENINSSKGIKVSFIQGYESFDSIPIDRLDATWMLPHPKITISKWLYDLAKYRFSQEDVFLVPNSVNREQFPYKPRNKNDVPSIGFLYHTMASKGVDICLNVVENLSTKYEKLNLITFGYGQFSPPLPKNVFLEHHDNPAQKSIKDIYAKCDVWLCGSYSEGFYLPHLEAMACGCPVVSTMVGGPLDNIVEGRNGYLVSIGDVDGLAARVQSILDLDDDGWLWMSQQAADTGADYSWDDASEKFERCLIEIFNRTNHPAST